MARTKRIFRIGGYASDPVRQENAKNGIRYADMKCEDCGSHVLDAAYIEDHGAHDVMPRGACIMCRDRAIVVDQAANLILGDGDTGLLREHEAKLILNHPEKVVVNCPCEVGHTGIRYKSSRICVACQYDARKKYIAKKKTPPHC